MRYLMLALCLLAPVWSLAQGDAGELLKNPGFDVDADQDGLPDGWSCSDKSVRRQEIQAFGGNYELVSQPGTYVLATQDVTLKPGQQYNLTMRLRCEGGALGGALVVNGPTKPEREFSIVWNLEGSDKYENHIATFKAPNPACRLFIYNVARKGTIYYDSVSLREGSPDQLIVQQLSITPIDRPLGEPPVTEHIPYGRNLAGGPLKSFITLRSFRHLREVTELAQRVDLDSDVLTTGYEGDEAVSETGRRMMQRLDDGFYEVYVVASRVSPAAVKTIQARVQNGAGLVVLEGFGQCGKFLDPKQLTDATPEHYVLRGVPWAVMPQGIMSSVQTGQLGQGRVVRLNFPIDACRVWGLIPIGLKCDDWIGRQWTYWDGWLSLLGKAMLWAARGEPPSKPSSAQVIYRSARELRFDGPNLRLAARPVALDAQGKPQLQAPAELPGGAVLADVMLRDQAGKTLDWATQVIGAPPQAKIVDLQAASPTVKPGEPVKLTMKVTADKPVAATVEARLIDAFGRDVATGRLTLEPLSGEAMPTIVLPLANPLCVHHKAFVRVLVGGKEQDSRWVPVRVPELGPRLAQADFLATPWGPGGFPAPLALLADRTRELGINGEFAVNQYLAGEHGMLAAGYCSGAGAFREESHPGEVRKMCLSDPAVVEKYTAAAREAAALQAPDGPYAVGITDEAFLSYHNMRQELCFCPLCTARFHKWLQARYPSLEALNAQWGTAYQAWDEVRGVKTEEIRGQQNFGRFVDFRTFMTDQWIEACKTITDAYHEVNPTIPMGHTNTFGCNPFNGNDYYKLATQTGFGWGQEYGEEVKASGNKAIFDVWRSFVETPEARRSRLLAGAPSGADHTGPASSRSLQTAPAPFFNHGWVGYDRRVPAAHYEPWWLALHDSRGVSYFATSAYDTPRGRSWALVYPTGCLTEYSAAVKEALADLRGGVGKVLMEYQRAQPQVAILWSHPSMLVSWCESNEDIAGDPPERDTSDSYASWFMSGLNFRQHLNELQLDYQYVAPDQILGSGELAPLPAGRDRPAGPGVGRRLEDYPLLVLPFTIAASDGLVDKLDTYLQQGGVIVGDMRCLRTDEHGKPDASGALQRLFGATRGGDVSYAESKVTFKQAGAGVDMTGQELTVYGKENLTAAGATPLAAHATGEPAVLVMEHGKGLSILLNFKLPQYDPTMRELLRQIVARAGVKREVTVEPVEGPATSRPARAYELNTFTRGPVTVHGLIRDFRRCEDSDPVVIRFGRKTHVFDMRAHKYVGEVDRVQATLAPGDTAVYALLPYRVEGLGMNVPAAVKAGEELVARINLIAGGAVGDHVAHVELLNPQGHSVWCYTRNELLPGGKGVVRVPLALNEAKGKWTLRVREVLTGAQSEAKFTVQ